MRTELLRVWLCTERDLFIPQPRRYGDVENHTRTAAWITPHVPPVADGKSMCGLSYYMFGNVSSAIFSFRSLEIIGRFRMMHREPLREYRARSRLWTSYLRAGSVIDVWRCIERDVFIHPL